jgi:hypothetical protein
MVTFKALALAALLSATAVTPTFAQAAISEPGAFQSLYPYRDVLNNGAPTRAAALVQEPPAVLQAVQESESGLPHHRAHHARR